MKLAFTALSIFSISAAVVALTAMRPIMIEQPHNTMCEQTTNILENDQAYLVLANATRGMR
jgi:hypothetical protein